MSGCPDAEVYQSKRRWYWACPCGKSAGPFPRRMDADDDLYEHDKAVRARQEAKPTAGRFDPD